MAEPPASILTTAIDYPNSRPHIGTAFEKLGADVQARYRRMEGYEVFFLMGNDENTVKVARRAAELGRDPKAYCDDMARQFQEVWRALDISYDDFIQTSEPRHHAGCRKFIQKVYDNGHIYKGSYEGWYCEGCEAFKTEKELEESRRLCPDPQDAARAPQRAVLLLRAVEVPGPAARVLRGEPRLHPAGEPAQRGPQPRADRAAGRQHHALRRRPGASACRSTRSSPSTSGSTRC